MLTVRECEELVAWNATSSEYPREAGVHDLFEAQVERAPDRAAVVFEGEALSYRELSAEAHVGHMRAGGLDAASIEDYPVYSSWFAGINATYANVRAGSDLLQEQGISPAMVATSSFRITWMLPRDRTNEAVQALHHRFIESAQPLLP